MSLGITLSNHKDNIPEKYYNMFSPSQFPLPTTWSDLPDPMMDRNTDPKRWVEYWKPNLPEMKRIYYGMNAAIDEYMGDFLKKLDDLGLTENTILVFSSDHGEMFGENGRIFKMTFYDPSARVPLLIRYPQSIKANTKDDICINTPDIMPTLLGLMNLPVPKSVEGIDLSKRIAEGKGKEPEMAFMQGMGHTYQWKDGYEWRSVRDKQFTYARYLKNEQELLFDNLNDPLQTVNLINNSAYEKTKKRMKKYMEDKMQLLNDEFKPCSYYQQWVTPDRCIIRSAKGQFIK